MWFIALSLAILLLNQLVPWGRQVWADRRTRSWPRTQATLDSSFFEHLNQKGRNELLVIVYRFLVDNESYFGRYEHLFKRRPDAEAVSLALRDRPFLVRYNPANPRDNLLDPHSDGPL